MSTKARMVALTAFAGLALAASAQADGLKSAGALAFGPNGVLFVADTQGGRLYAVETGDAKGGEPAALNVKNLNGAIAELLGAKAQNIAINDVVVNPASGRAYISVTRGQGADAAAAILSVGSDGKIKEVDLEKSKHTSVALPAPPKAGPRTPRADAVTDIAFVDGKVYVAGLSNEEFSSRLMALAYPFEEGSSANGAGIEIFHGAHGRFETNSPVRTFVPYALKDQTFLLAAYTCTPLVKISVNDLKPGAKVKGTTIAELGNRNRPLDMIVYTKGGKDYLLLANSSRGVMKIPTEGADSAKSITQPVKDKEGLGYETIADLKGVEQLDKLDATHAVIVSRSPEGSLDLTTIDLP